MKKFLTTLLLLASISCQPGSVQAQEKNVPFNGIVTDVADTPIKGVRIWIKTENIYARTDKKGRFGLTNVHPTDTLHVKYKKLYYAFPVEGRKSIRIKLGDQHQISEDDELANIGYGWVSHRERTIPTSGISGEELIKSGKTNLLEALQGKVAGLSIHYTNGKPRALIRGMGTISNETDPLFLIDGSVVDNLDFLNVYDVEHVEVLKDASIYGSRGANGAILVTTRRGPSTN